MAYSIQRPFKITGPYEDPYRVPQGNVSYGATGRPSAPSFATTAQGVPGPSTSNYQYSRTVTPMTRDKMQYLGDILGPIQAQVSKQTEEAKRQARELAARQGTFWSSLLPEREQRITESGQEEAARYAAAEAAKLAAYQQPNVVETATGAGVGQGGGLDLGAPGFTMGRKREGGGTEEGGTQTRYGGLIGARFVEPGTRTGAAQQQAASADYLDALLAGFGITPATDRTANLTTSQLRSLATGARLQDNRQYGVSPEEARAALVSRGAY